MRWFRQETTAIAADEEGMFHQASPDGQLNEQPQEYRMVKLVWCYTSSPSVANFCLKSTASIDGTEFDPDVVQTLERTMYICG